MSVTAGGHQHREDALAGVRDEDADGIRADDPETRYRIHHLGGARPESAEGERDRGVPRLGCRKEADGGDFGPAFGRPFEGRVGTRRQAPALKRMLLDRRHISRSSVARPEGYRAQRRARGCGGHHV